MQICIVRDKGLQHKMLKKFQIERDVKQKLNIKKEIQQCTSEITQI